MDRNVTAGNATKASDQNYSVKIVTGANYVQLDTDKYDEYWFDPDGANRTFTFAVSANNPYRKSRIRHIGTGAHKVTLLPNGAEKILVYSGNEKWELASFELLQQDDWADFISNSAGWAKCNTPYWHKFVNPTVGYKASKTTGWTADQFTPGGLEVTFSEAPLGSLAVKCLNQQATNGWCYFRKSGDTNITNTPHASTEYSHGFRALTEAATQIVFWLSISLKTQFAVQADTVDLYIAYPLEYLQ